MIGSIRGPVYIKIKQSYFGVFISTVKSLFLLKYTSLNWTILHSGKMFKPLVKPFSQMDYQYGTLGVLKVCYYNP